MKVSQYLLRYQISGEIPDGPPPHPDMAFWCGWLLAHAFNGRTTVTYDEAKEMAIKAARFIEEQCEGDHENARDIASSQ